MTKEQPQASEGFGFTDNERLFSRVHDRRMNQFLTDDMTRIHDIELSSNNYGEFLFVTLSREDDPERGYVTFFGLGFHEGSDRWIINEWFWYRGNGRTDLKHEQIAHEQALLLVEAQRAEVQGYAALQWPQSKRGQLFEILAELTDDDAATAELEDLGDIFDE